MRCYTDIEVRTITEQRVPSARLEPSVRSKESASVSPTYEHAMDELSISTHIELPEMMQFIADLEFETKFAALLRSIALRWPLF